MEHYLIDTNVVSDYFSASFSNAGMEFMSSVIDDTPNLSVITKIELLCWKTDDSSEQSIHSFINDSMVIGITDNVVDECVKIRKGKKIKTPDAIIAATSLANNYTLITNNEKDFNGISGLKIINPYKL
jgi:predicted nucleic acid-binding protein